MKIHDSFRQKPVRIIPPSPEPAKPVIIQNRADLVSTMRWDKQSRWALVGDYPPSWILQGRFSGRDIAQVRQNHGARYWTERALDPKSFPNKRSAIASTTPILGQYSPQFGFPDDWGWYWEYLDAYLFVPEVAMAIKLKNRQIWKTGYQFQCSSDDKSDKMQKEFKRLKLFDVLFDSSKTALIEGNDYVYSQDDSVAQFKDGQFGDAAVGVTFTSPTGMPRPLKSYKAATKFYGLTDTDPRTVRQQVDPTRWDPLHHTPLIEKYIQRLWNGPLGPANVLGSQVEYDFLPDQMFHLCFNRIFGGIYGYSTFRETLFTLKGYLLMQQFLPQIVEHRADPLLSIIIGGEMTGPAGIKQTWLPQKEDFEIVKTRLAARMPGEDVFIDALTKIEEVYKGRGSAERVSEYITTYKERVLLGLGIPMAAATFSGGGEIKFGTLQFELMDDETREHQMATSRLINDWVLPKVNLNLGHKQGDGPEMEFVTVPPGETAKR